MAYFAIRVYLFINVDDGIPLFGWIYLFSWYKVFESATFQVI
jgi:hypothetical protein